jgi:hypothetical protein
VGQERQLLGVVGGGKGRGGGRGDKKLLQIETANRNRIKEPSSKPAKKKGAIAMLSGVIQCFTV